MQFFWRRESRVFPVSSRRAAVLRRLRDVTMWPPSVIPFLRNHKPEPREREQRVADSNSIIEWFEKKKKEPPNYCAICNKNFPSKYGKISRITFDHNPRAWRNVKLELEGEGEDGRILERLDYSAHESIRETNVMGKYGYSIPPASRYKLFLFSFREFS